jgi:hypothetical protein
VILAPALAFLLAAAPSAGPTARTVISAVEVTASDSLRQRAGSRIARHRRTTVAMGAVVSGYLSSRGLPPRAGVFAVTDTGLVFRSFDGRWSETYPLVGPVRTAGGRPWRASTVSLAYVDQDAGRIMYVFRLAGGVFQTEAPGALLEVVDREDWVDSVTSREWQPDQPLIAAGNLAGARRLTERITGGAYADTLYALFGRPARPAGQVGERGRRAGRLGEYLARRDSLALDPTRITSEEQLRHTLAHELGHRWQSRARGQITLLWQGTPTIRDPRRYGYGSTTEHQAEAIAFAVHFLQATTAAPAGDHAIALLDQYEQMVPGTGVMARYLAMQPIYGGHPLRPMLTQGYSR